MGVRVLEREVRTLTTRISKTKERGREEGRGEGEEEGEGEGENRWDVGSVCVCMYAIYANIYPSKKSHL